LGIYGRGRISWRLIEEKRGEEQTYLYIHEDETIEVFVFHTFADFVERFLAIFGNGDIWIEH